jgi:hypothetical protein
MVGADDGPVDDAGPGGSGNVYDGHKGCMNTGWCGLRPYAWVAPGWVGIGTRWYPGGRAPWGCAWP